MSHVYSGHNIHVIFEFSEEKQLKRNCGNSHEWMAIYERTTEELAGGMAIRRNVLATTDNRLINIYECLLFKMISSTKKFLSLSLFPLDSLFFLKTVSQSGTFLLRKKKLVINGRNSEVFIWLQLFSIIFFFQSKISNVFITVSENRW